MLASVIAMTKNEEKSIGDCLESLRKQTYLQVKTGILNRETGG